MWQTERRIAKILFSLVLIVSIAHLIWAASTTENGWKYVGHSVSDAAYGWFPNQSTVPAISDSDPEKLADFWLKEIDRITVENPDSAELAMGCALFLHAKTGMNVPFFPTKSGSLQVFDSNWDLTAKLMKAEEKLNRMEFLTKNRCLELAKRATELEPKNKTWWQLRAMLLFSDPLVSELRSRTDDWENILKEVAAHDSDNALYDYLAAKYFWENSFGYEEIEGTEEYRTTIEDRKSADRGLTYFRSGLKKKYFTIANKNSIDINSLLKKTSVEEINHTFMSSSILFSIFLHNGYRIDHLAGQCESLAGYHKDRAEPKKALQLWRDSQDFQKQRRIQNEQDIPRLTAYADYRAAQKILELEVQFPGLLDEREKKSLQEKLPALKLDTLVYKTASDNLSPDYSSLTDYHRIFPYWIAYEIAFPSAILAIYGIALCLLLGAIAFAFNGFSFSLKPPFEFGITRHLGIWFSVFSLSLLITHAVLVLSQSRNSEHAFFVHPVLWIVCLAMGGVTLVRAAMTTDRYTRNQPRRSSYSLLWFLLLLISMAILWFAISLCREFFVTSFRSQPALFLAGWMFAILLLGTWLKLIYRKSKTVELKENQNRLGTAFAILVPTALFLTLVIRLPIFLGYEWRDPHLKGLLGIEGSGNWENWEYTDPWGMDNGLRAMNEGIGIINGWSMMYGTILFLFFVSILVGLSVFWQRKRYLESLDTTPDDKPKTALWSTMFRKMATSSFALSMLGLFLWTLMMPFSMQLVEKFEAIMTTGVDYPYEHKLMQFEEIKKIRADDSWMNDLREQAKTELAEDIERRKEEAAEKDKKKTKNNKDTDLETVRDKFATVDTING